MFTTWFNWWANLKCAVFVRHLTGDFIVSVTSNCQVNVDFLHQPDHKPIKCEINVTIGAIIAAAPRWTVVEKNQLKIQQNNESETIVSGCLYVPLLAFLIFYYEKLLDFLDVSFFSLYGAILLIKKAPFDSAIIHTVVCTCQASHLNTMAMFAQCFT